MYLMARDNPNRVNNIDSVYILAGQLGVTGYARGIYYRSVCYWLF